MTVTTKRKNGSKTRRRRPFVRKHYNLTERHTEFIDGAAAKLETSESAVLRSIVDEHMQRHARGGATA